MIFESEFNFDQRLMRDLMSDISQKSWSAQWLVDLEYILWDAAHNDVIREDDEGYPVLDGGYFSEEIVFLARLSRDIGGWIIWHTNPPEYKGISGNYFVTMDQWLKMVEGEKNQTVDTKPPEDNFNFLLGEN